MRILIVKLSSMGDIVHALPLVSDLRLREPSATIEWVVERNFEAIPRLHPAIDAVIPIEWRRWRRSLASTDSRDGLRAFLRRLRERRFDLVLDCQGLIKSAIVARLAPAARRVGPSWTSARESLASLAYGRHAVVPREWHVVRRNRAIGKAAFDDPSRCDPDDSPACFGLVVAPFAAGAASWMPAGRVAVLVTGASRPQKLWPDEHWVAVALRLLREGIVPVWLWGSDAERHRAESLARRSAVAQSAIRTGAGDGGASAGPSGATAARVACGIATAPDVAGGVLPPFLSVADAARVLAAATIVVGLDTGFTHLAGALGRPTIAIFCDFDARQCAVTGDGFCASFGGVGQVPGVAEVVEAIDQALG